MSPEMSSKKNIHYRTGRPGDTEQLLELIQELADYEKAPEEVINTAEQLKEDAFGPQPVFGFLVAESNGKLLGASIHYYRYSTWKGRCLYLEDIIVKEAARGQGIGSRLFALTARFATQNNCSRLVWQVLDWNDPAINFYRKWDASFDAEWTNCMLDEQALIKAAQKAQ